MLKLLRILPLLLENPPSFDDVTLLDLESTEAHVHYEATKEKVSEINVMSIGEVVLLALTVN